MRTTLGIDEALMNAAMRSGDFKTKKATVEAALRLLVREASAYGRLPALGGDLDWGRDPRTTRGVVDWAKVDTFRARMKKSKASVVALRKQTRY